MIRKIHFPLAILSGVLLALPWIINSTGIISLFALIPLLIIEDHIQKSRTNHKFALTLKYSTLTFFIWNVIATYWIKNADLFAAITVICSNTFVMSLTFGLFHITKERFGSKTGNFSLIVYWISFEYLFLHAHLTWPWLNLGNAFAGNIKLIQWYEYSGTLGGTLWILTSNILIFTAVKEYLTYKDMKVMAYWIILTTIIVISPIILSKHIFKQYNETGTSFKFAIVQPNFDAYKEKYLLSQDFQLNTILELATSAIDEKTIFVIAPETSISKPILETTLASDSSILKIRQWLENYPQVSFLIGASTNKKTDPIKEIPAIAKFNPVENYYYISHNSALQIDTSKQIPIYYKSKLVSGVETMPLLGIFSFLENFTLDFGGVKGSLGTQKDREVFIHHNKEISIAPVICYESSFGEHVTEYIKKGANIISVITNDGWWGDTPVYEHHLNYARLRAIENRRSIARSANTGISAFINQRGEIIQKINCLQQGIITDTLKSNNQITFYANYGDYIGRIANFLSILLILYTFVVRFTMKSKLTVK